MVLPFMQQLLYVPFGNLSLIRPWTLGLQNILGQLRPCSPMSDILSSAEEVFGKGVTVVFGTMFKQEAMNLSSLAMGGEFISLLLV